MGAFVALRVCPRSVAPSSDRAKAVRHFGVFFIQRKRRVGTFEFPYVDIVELRETFPEITAVRRKETSDANTFDAVFFHRPLNALFRRRSWRVRRCHV